jgi:AraC-like DNA-binding protein
LNERDTPRIKHDPPRGILNLRPGERPQDLTRYWPSAALAPFVEHYWIVRWDLGLDGGPRRPSPHGAQPRGAPHPRGRESLLGAPFVAETVPHPSVHVVIDATGTGEVVGVLRSKFSRVLEGRGRAVGTKFLPGAFRAFVDRPVSRFTDQRLEVRDVFGARGEALASAVAREEDDRSAVAAIESFLLACEPVADDAMRLVRSISARIADDRTVTRVDQIIAELGIGTRRLQRMFHEYVGVGPKWMIQRYRLLDAAERVGGGEIVDWSRLALELGYADQAHFIRDFKKLVGRSPADYARSLRTAPHPRG